MLREWLASEKKRLLHAPQRRNGTVAENLNQRRFARNVVQRAAKQLRKYRPSKLPKAVLAFRYRDVPLLDGFYPNRKDDWRPILRRAFVEPPPVVKLKDFSFVSNAVQTMEMLAELVRLDGVATQARIDFEDMECLDIGPFLLLQAIRQHIAPIFSGGVISIETSRVIDAVGLRAALHMSPFSMVADHDGIWPFTLRRRRPANTSSSENWQLEPQNREVVADQFIDKVDDWLGEVAKQQLTQEGRGHVKKMIGEALDNAERHSQLNTNDGDWAITGYLVKRQNDGEKTYRIHMAMLSVGATIDQSIRSGPAEMLKHMDVYVAKHRSRSQPEEALRTVFALQDGVTKDHAAAAEGRGGTGFQDIFAFFADLGATKSPLHRAELAIISGKTCVKLCNQYLSGKAQETGERSIWFNPSNSANFPPALDHVFMLPHELRGTLVTMAIPLDTEYLESSADDSDRPDSLDEGRGS